MGREGDVAPSTMTEVERLEKKLEMRLQREGVKPKEGSFANRAICHQAQRRLDYDLNSRPCWTMKERDEDQI